MATAERNKEFQKKVSKAVKPVVSITLDLPPSCIEFLPRESASSNASSWLEDRHFFVAGTYNLEKESESTAAESNSDPVGAEKLSFEDAEDGPDAPAPHAPKPQSRNGSLILFSINGDEL
jgi:diphthamide biosynthesis protein 7